MFWKERRKFNIFAPAGGASDRRALSDSAKLDCPPALNKGTKRGDLNVSSGAEAQLKGGTSLREI
jgi:hypothetical protein